MVGIDLAPLDVTDPGDAAWLRALVVPDQRRRHERLAAALEVVAEDPPDLVAGDALEGLPGVLEGFPGDAAVCVFSTLTLYQFDERERAELRRQLAEFGRDREVHWLSGDPTAETDHPTYRHVVLSADRTTERRLAEYQSYGEWLRWLAE